MVCLQYTRCGKSSCRCTLGGDNRHGPYFVRCYRWSGGRQVRCYVRPDEVEATRAAWQELKAHIRQERRRNALALRLMKRYVHSVESRAA